MKRSKAEKARRRKYRSRVLEQRIERRLQAPACERRSRPAFSASNIQYEIAERARGLDCGGIGAMHLLAQKIGLVDDLDEQLSLLKRHLPYHESDHILNIAYNSLAGGTCLEDLELRRNDEVYMDALGAERIPDPTTAGDFCRRFREEDVETLMSVYNGVRRRVWSQQPESFFDEAVIDADGTIVGTTGECKEGMDLSYKKIWGYHPLLVSLSNTQEPLFLVNRSGNRPSNEGAAERLDQAISLCRDAGFRDVTVRGDTAFYLTDNFDRWDKEGVRFILGCPVHPNLHNEAMELEEDDWKPLERPAKYYVETEPRGRRHNVKLEVVKRRGYQHIRLKSEHVAEIRHSPTKCWKTYRLIIVRKNLSIERGEDDLIDDIRYFMYMTNDWKTSAEEIVFLANNRCDQENLIEQLKNGARALKTPMGNLVSNWAYMVIGALAWNLKAWYALLLPEKGRWKETHRREKRHVLRMEFKSFINAFVRMPAQLVKGARRIVYRLLNWNPYQRIFLRALDMLERPRLC